MKDKPTLGVVRGIVRISIFAGFTFLLLTVISGFGQSVSANPFLDHSEKAAMREVRETAAHAAGILNVYVDARVTEMLVCSKLGGPIRDALTTPNAKSGANQVLAGWLETSGAYDAILLLNRKGMCIASAPSSLVHQDFSNHEAFKGAVKGDLSIIDAHKSEILTTLDPKSKGWTVVISVPVKASDDVAGVLMSCVNMSKLRELLMSIRVATTPFVETFPTGRLEISTGYVYVLNQKNQVIIHLNEKYCGQSLDEIGAPPEIGDAIKEKRANQKHGYKNSRTGQTEKGILAGFAYPKGYGNFPGLGWTVGASAFEHVLIGAPWWMQLFP